MAVSDVIETEEVEESAEAAPVAEVEESPDDSEANADLEIGYAADIPTQTDATPPVVEDAAASPAPEPIYAKISEDEYKRFLANAETVEKIASSLEQRFGTAFGHIGGIEQKLKEIQAGTHLGQAIKLTKEDFVELQAEFPEFADLQMKGLERALSRFTGTGTAPGLDEAKAGELFDSKLVTFERKILKNTLTDLHEDWESVVGGTKETWEKANPGQPYKPSAYREWLATQPQAYQDDINASLRPVVIAKSITKFKEFAAAATAKPKSPAPRTNAAAEARREELRGAVTPKGSGGSKAGRTELDDLQAGFDA